MGMLRKIADRFDPPPALETRAVDASWEAMRAGAGHAWPGPIANKWNGQLRGVTPTLAETLATVTACVNAIAAALASLPALIYFLKMGVRKEAPDHPLARLIRRGPNARQSWPEFIEQLVASALLYGNGLAEIVTNRRGEIVELKLHPWPNVTPLLLPSGRLAFDVVDMTTLAGGSGKTRRLLDSEVIHLKDRTDDGFIGRSRLARCASPIRVSLTQESFGENLYENRATPSAAVSFEAPMSPENFERARSAINQGWTGVSNAGKVLLLDSGAKVQPFGLSPESLEMLEARRLSVEELARLFAVPPPIIGDYRNNTFTNAAQAALWFGQHCLSPWIRKIEEAFRRSILSDEYELHLDLSGFLRGDPETRWKAHEIAVKNRILTANEVREVEGWNQRPDLDTPPPAPGVG